MTRQEWQTLKVQDFERLEAENEALRTVQINTRDALLTVLTVLDGHFETLQRLAMNYPEAFHVLSSPRKHSSMVLLEQIIHRLDLTLARQQPTGEAEGDA